jgi:hypothetical protein
VRRVGRGLAVLMIGAVFFTVAAGIAGAKTVSNEKYAKKLCGTVNGVLADIDDLEQPTTEDPASYQTEALAALDEIIGSMETAATKLKKLSPEDGGKKVTKLFNQYLTDFTAEFQSARDDFAAADPTSPAFSADVTVLGVTLQNASLGIDDPFSKLSDNQDLLGAFGDEKSCSEIVTVYGG